MACSVGKTLNPNSLVLTSHNTSQVLEALISPTGATAVQHPLKLTLGPLHEWFHSSFLASEFWAIPDLSAFRLGLLPNGQIFSFVCLMILTHGPKKPRPLVSPCCCLGLNSLCVLFFPLSFWIRSITLMLGSESLARPNPPPHPHQRTGQAQTVSSWCRFSIFLRCISR